MTLHKLDICGGSCCCYSSSLAINWNSVEVARPIAAAFRKWLASEAKRPARGNISICADLLWLIVYGIAVWHFVNLATRQASQSNEPLMAKNRGHFNWDSLSPRHMLRLLSENSRKVAFPFPFPFASWNWELRSHWVAQSCEPAKSDCSGSLSGNKYINALIPCSCSIRKESKALSWLCRVILEILKVH